MSAGDPSRAPRRRSGGGKRAIGKRSAAAGRSAATDVAAATGVSARAAALLFAAFLAIGFFVCGPVLDGAFVSDDHPIIVDNPFVQALTLENVRAMFDPSGPAIVWAMNYSPVHLLGVAAEVRAFGSDTTGYHVVNLFLHAANALLVVLLLRAGGVPQMLATAAGAVFAAHPANLEAVAMIWQSKTLLSTGLGLAALLLVWRRPALATACFALALLTKISAVFVLPTGLVWAWTRAGERSRPAPARGWWLAWLAILVLVAAPELAAFQRTGVSPIPAGGPLERTREIVAIAGRYLVMAATSFGVSTFQQPPPPRSWLDPWLLSGAALLGLLAWRLLVVLRRRSDEAGFWMLAVAAFAPVSQVFPFLYPMADRYLYSVLPGLLGGTLLAALEGAERVAPRVRRWRGSLPPPRRLEGAAAALLLAIAAVFAVQARLRSPVFGGETAITREAVRNFPHGIWGRMAEAKRSGDAGDAAGAAQALAAMREQGFVNFPFLEQHPMLQPVVQDPRVRAEFARMAEVWITRFGSLSKPHQVELLMLAQAHVARGEYDDAIRALERGVAAEGPHRDALAAMLEQVRAQARRPGARSGGRPGAAGS